MCVCVCIMYIYIYIYYVYLYMYIHIYIYKWVGVRGLEFGDFLGGGLSCANPIFPTEIPKKLAAPMYPQ